MWIDDQILTKCDHQIESSVWVPESCMVVLGCSNKAEVEVQQDDCARDGVPILKRYGGGGTVVLYPGCVVASVGTWVQSPYQNQRYFKALNHSIIEGLADIHSELIELRQDGISDIVWGHRKVAGTSMFRSRNYLLFQASILVDFDVSIVDRYLKHPSREPEYRRGRSHGDFLTGLNAVVNTTPDAVREGLVKNWQAKVRAALGSEILPPQKDQFPNLHKRVARARQHS